MLHITDNIKKVRKLTGMTQEEFSEKIGEKRSTYAEWENNIVPDLVTLQKIAETAGVTLYDLIGEPGSLKKPNKTNDQLVSELIDINKTHADANKENSLANKTHADSINRLVILLEQKLSSGKRAKASGPGNQEGKGNRGGTAVVPLSDKRKRS